MDSDKSDNPRKLLIIGLAVGAVLIIVLSAYVITTLSHGGTSAQGENQLKLKPAGNDSISNDQLSLVKGILQSRFHDQGYAASVKTMRDDRGNAFVLVNYSTTPYRDMLSVSTTPGVFEMRIQANESESEHVLYADDVKNVGNPVPEALNDSTTEWGVPFWLTDAGAEKFQLACINTGATQDPNSHNILMLLDDNTFLTKPLSPDMADSIATKHVDTMMAMTGTGDAGKALAYKVYASLRDGSLPMGLELVSSINATTMG